MKLIGQNACHDKERTLPIAGVPCQISGVDTVEILSIDAKWFGSSASLILSRVLVMIGFLADPIRLATHIMSFNRRLMAITLAPVRTLKLAPHSPPPGPAGIKDRKVSPFPEPQRSGAVAHRPAAGMAAEF